MSGVRDRFEYLCLVWLTGGPAILHEKLSGSLSLRMLHSTAGSAVLQGCTYSLPFFTPDIVAWRTQIIKESLSNQLIQLLNGRGVVKRMVQHQSRVAWHQGESAFCYVFLLWDSLFVLWDWCLFVCVMGWYLLPN